ncbi:MAG TPA: PilX N-terminal domain-containing pilus assembly protein [Burkholderiales bacterium]|nr:PilX N-terminal domain-containing pilus assembly protein [Burkholderiales bacterium]
MRNLQRGATLFITLIMLVVISLFLVSALNTATTNLKVVGNMQARNEAIQVAQEAIETVVSSTLFISNPSNAVLNPCGSANTLCKDFNLDDTTSTASALYTTQLTPNPGCVAVRAIKNSELNLAVTEDLGCAAGQSQQFGVSGAVTGDSLCSQTVWEITARTTDSSTGASVTLTQGVSVRVSADDASASCL